MTQQTLDELQSQLEQLVDSWNLATVLDVLAKVCTDKEDHVRSVWQDAVLARDWEAAQMDLDRVARRREERTGEKSQAE